MYDDERDEEEGTGSRLFVILAIALIGLLVLGLLGIGGVFVIRQNIEEQTAASRPTPNIPVRLPEPTQTFTPSPVPTNTPAPTPTNTPVVGAGGEAASSQDGAGTLDSGREAGRQQQGGEGSPTPKPSPTRTPVPSGETAGSAEVPNTGLGAIESVLIAAGLIFVFIVARRMRMAA